MLVGIIYSTEKKVIGKLAEGLKRGLEEQGQNVRMYPDNLDTYTGIASCNHIFVGTHITSAFKTKTPERLRDVLAKLPGISGKRAIAFVPKGGIGERKALVALMGDMERQGCYIIDQRAFSSEEDAYRFGKTINLRD
ncbi:MAG: hypothetical protein ACUVWJ_07075 [Spirochaetota bacterium]